MSIFPPRLHRLLTSAICAISAENDIVNSDIITGNNAILFFACSKMSHVVMLMPLTAYKGLHKQQRTIPEMGEGGSRNLLKMVASASGDTN